MSRQYCTFHVHEHLLAVPIEAVREVLTGQRLVRVPLAPDAVPGLLNLRGQIVTVVDLRHRLRLPARSTDEPGNLHVIVATGDGAVSLLADRAGEVLSPAEELFEPAPDTIEPGIRQLVTAVCKLDGQLMLVLDIDHTIAVGGAA
jgi:purine-binding chemotaxis protein CheW